MLGLIESRDDGQGIEVILGLGDTEVDMERTGRDFMSVD